MDISVAICTWNRARLLDATLNQMRKLRVPPGVEWELLVVNNCCTDDTDDVIAAHAADLPLRRLYEPKPGLSNARNCAVAAATGDVLIWTDDDVLVDENWLAEYHRASMEFPQAVYFGGAVDPLFEVEAPSWVHRHPRLVEGPFALRQFGSRVRPFADDEFPFGANMAFRLARLADRLTFDPNLGRAGKTLISGDETEALRALKREHAAGIWVGTARVRHFIPRERLTLSYVWKWWAGLGATEVRRNGMPRGRAIFNVPPWMVRQCCEELLQMLRSFLRMDDNWPHFLMRAARTSGALREVVRQSAAAKQARRVAA